MSGVETACQCVILAGGLGTRMYPDTRTVPKTLLEVLGKPFAFYQLAWMRDHGVTDVLYCIGHMGALIRRAIGDGQRFGLSVRYCDEGEQLRGTGGALRLAAEKELLKHRFLVTYGDSFLRIDFASVLSALPPSAAAMLVVYRNKGNWDVSNVRLQGSRVALYHKGEGAPSDLEHIDYGLAAMQRDLFTSTLPQEDDLSEMYRRLSLEGRLEAYLATERFYEIGSREGYADFARWAVDHPMSGR